MYCTLYFTIFPDRSPALDRSAASWYNIEVVATNPHMYALVLANYIEKERADTMKLINTMTSILAAGAVLSAFAAAASAETAETSETAETAETSAFGTTGAWSDIAGETSTSYDNLFDVILDDKYSDIWYKYCASVAGEDNAEEAAASLNGSISSDAYGQEALDRIAETGAAAFDCWYINGAAQFTFNSDLTATVTLTDSTESTHAYEYLGQYNVGDGEGLYVAYDNEAYEAEHADYTLTTDGETVLTLTNDEGSITYVKRAENSGVASGETSGETKGSPDTGAEGVAVFTALALTACAALTLSRKR